MIQKIAAIKDKVLEFMDQEAGKYGNARMDVKEMGDLADIVKDLAEAEYYCTVAQAMEGGQQQGYMPMQGYGSGGSMQSSGRQGYGGSMGHTDPMSTLRDMLATASPEQRMQIRSEVNQLMGM